MSRLYTATLQSAAVSQGATLLQLPVSASQVIRPRSMFIGQSSDAGDANAAMCRVVMHRVTGVVTNGTGGAAVTPRPHDTVLGAFSGTVRMGDVTTFPTTAGTAVVIFEETFNVQAGWYYTPTPEELFELHPSETLWVSVGAPTEDFAGGPIDITNDFTASMRCTFEVFGAL